jgi:hypothetical protein
MYLVRHSAQDFCLHQFASLIIPPSIIASSDILPTPTRAAVRPHPSPHQRAQQPKPKPNPEMSTSNTKSVNAAFGALIAQLDKLCHRRDNQSCGMCNGTDCDVGCTFN